MGFFSQSVIIFIIIIKLGFTHRIAVLRVSLALLIISQYKYHSSVRTTMCYNLTFVDVFFFLFVPAVCHGYADSFFSTNHNPSYCFVC